MNFNDAVKEVLKHEGGARITEDPKDPGGLTKYGISKRAYPDLDIRNLTEADAIAIYKRDYWDKIGGDSIRPYSVAFAIFDQAVNRGVSAALKQAQTVVSLVPDGKLSTQTILAINLFSEKLFIDSYLALSKAAYQKIAARNPAQEAFLGGWLNRVSSLKDYTTKALGSVNKTSVSLAAVAGLIFLFLVINSSKRA